MCTVKPKFVTLPEQHSLCSLPNSGCRYVEVKTGRSKWEKRTAVLVRVDGEPAPKILIYTYFLKGLGAGKPLIGQIYSMFQLKKLEARQEKEGQYLVNLITEKAAKLTFKIDGKEAGGFVAALISGNLTSLGHHTHAAIQDGTVSDIVSDLKDKPDTTLYTGSREGYVAPPKEASGSEEKKKKKAEEKEKEKKEEEPVDEKKKESLKKLQKTISKTKTKTQSSKSKRKEGKSMATQQTQEAQTAVGDEPAGKTNSEPDVEVPVNLDKTQTEGNQGSSKGTKADGQQAQTSTTPGSSLTPGLTPAQEERKKTLTNSDEVEPPANVPKKTKGEPENP